MWRVTLSSNSRTIVASASTSNGSRLNVDLDGRLECIVSSDHTIDDGLQFRLGRGHGFTWYCAAFQCQPALRGVCTYLTPPFNKRSM